MLKKRPARLLLTTSVLTANILLIMNSDAALATSSHRTTAPSHSFSIQPYQLRPAVQLEGAGGSQTFATGQMLWPVDGNTEHVWFASVEAAGFRDNNGWLAGGGAGYRRVVSDRILGGYLLADYNTSQEHLNVLTINPGFESLGEVWDFRANAYFPINGRKINTLGWAYADFGISDYLQATGHTLRDQQLVNYTETGPGADIEIGAAPKTLKKLHLKAYLGGYYFHMPDAGGVTGVEARVEYKLNHYTSLEVKDTYDHLRHNTTTIGIKFNFGGFNKNEELNLGISGRLLEPIAHNISSNGKFGYTAPVAKKLVTTIGDTKVYLDHVQYIRYAPADFPASSTSIPLNQIGDGTAENPYNGFRPSTITSIQSSPDGSGAGYANLFFSSGTYDLTNFSNRLALPSNYSIYGRSDNYKLPSNTTTFIGGLDLFNGGNTIDSVTFKSSANTTRYQEIGVQIGDGTNSVDNITFNNSTIGTSSGDDSYDMGIYAQNAKINFTSNNVVNSTSELTFSKIASMKQAAVSLTNSTLNINGQNNTLFSTSYQDFSDSVSQHTNRSVIAAYLNNSTLNIAGNNNSLKAFASYGGTSNANNGIAVWADKSSILIPGSNNSILATGGNNPANSSASGYADADVILFTSGNRDQNILTISGNSNLISAIANGQQFPAGGRSGVHAYGIWPTSGTSATITISGNNNTLEVHSDNAYVFGILAQQGPTGGQDTIVNISGNNNIFDASSNGGTSDVFRLENVNGNGSFTMSGNGNLIKSQGTTSATGIFSNQGTGSTKAYTPISITGTNNTIQADATSAGSTAFGIIFEGSAGDGGTLSNVTVKNTTFNIGQRSSAATATSGIYFRDGTMTLNSTNASIDHNTFNVAGTGSNVWGVAKKTAMDATLQTNLINQNIFYSTNTAGAATQVPFINSFYYRKPEQQDQQIL